MPYKRVGTAVYVKKGGKWVLLKRYKTVKEAIDYKYALEKNVRH